MSFLNQTGIVAGRRVVLPHTNAGATYTLTSPQVTGLFSNQNNFCSRNILVGDPAFLYKSTDLGNSWQIINIMPVSGPASTFDWFSMDKFGSTMVLSGAFGVVAKSTDNGLTWSSNILLNTNIFLTWKGNKQFICGWKTI
jgi:photosystem II stability/assembly factor-like uncharacterized protein